MQEVFAIHYSVSFLLCSTESKQGYLSISGIHKCGKQDKVDTGIDSPPVFRQFNAVFTVFISCIALFFS